jgi:hypothetical protein
MVATVINYGNVLFIMVSTLLILKYCIDASASHMANFRFSHYFS